MKKVAAVLLSAVLVVCLFAGCGGGPSGANGQVNVYNWGECVDLDLLKQFEKDTGIKVNYNTYESNEQMYSVIRQGGVNYDVVIPSDYMISRMIEEDMLEPINFDNIPNFELVDDSLKNPQYDPDNAYSVPYMWGTVGIIYDPNKVGEVTGWDALFDEANAGQVLMFDNSRDAMGIALMELGYSLNTTDMDELNEAFELLQRQKSILQGYVMDQIFDKLESGEAAIGPYYAGDYLIMLENNPDLEFCVPEGGTNVFVDAMCILKGAQNKENAEIFINYMSGTDASAKNAAVIGYTSPNVEVRDLLDLDEEAMAIMYPSDEMLSKCEAYVNLPKDVLDFYDSMWISLKS